MTAKKTVAKASKAPAKKAAVKKPVAKKPAAKKAPAKKAPAKKKVATKASPKLMSARGEAAFKQVQQEAYYLAEKDGFRRDPIEYWCAAEVHLGMRKG